MASQQSSKPGYGLSTEVSRDAVASRDAVGGGDPFLLQKSIRAPWANFRGDQETLVGVLAGIKEERFPLTGTLSKRDLGPEKKARRKRQNRSRTSTVVSWDEIREQGTDDAKSGLFLVVGSLFQVIERMDIQAAMATLDDDTITSDQVKDLFTGLGEKAKASATRVSALPSSQQNIAELEACKERLQAKLKHLRSTTDVLGNLKAADNAS